MPVALFGITNEGLNLFVNLLILFLVVVWIALVVWTYFDARRRLSDPVLIATATAASLFPFVGTIIYSILRPPEYVEDRRERELETRAAELRVRQLEEQSCPNCGHPIERTYLRCPSCRARVKDPCEACGRPIDPRWAICPYCETPVRGLAPATRRTERSGAARRAAAAQRKSSRQARPTRKPAAARPVSARSTRPATARNSGNQQSSASPPPSPATAAREPSEDEPRPAAR
jgi:hypothetical protein